MEKNEFGQYSIEKPSEAGEKPAFIDITPNAYFGRDGEYFCWMHVGDGVENSVLLSLRLNEIAVLEEAFADFRGNVEKSKQVRRERGESVAD